MKMVYKNVLVFSVLIFLITIYPMINASAGSDIYVVTKAPEFVESGEQVNFEITVINTSSKTVSDLDLINEIPPGLNYHNNPRGISLKWPLDDFKPGEKRQFNFAVDTSSPGTYMNIADIYTADKIIISRDRTFVRVIGSDAVPKEPEDANPMLSLTSYDTEDPLKTGSLITYVIVVKNEGLVTCKNIRLNNVIPQNMIFNFANPTPTTIQGKLIQYPTIIALKPGSKYIYKVTCEAVKEGLAINTATAACDGLEKRITVEETTQVVK